MLNNIVFAVGGTGGHLIPAQILQRKLCDQYDITFAGIGLKLSQLEGNVVDITGANFSIRQGLSSLIKMSHGVWQSIKLLKKLKPKMVVGFGSYHSFPVVIAAYLLRIDYILYEPNRKAGRVNRLLSSRALFTALLFESLQDELKCPFKTIDPLITFNKYEKGEARLALGLQLDKPTLLVFGGSQGAKSINDAMKRLAGQLNSALQVFHICGYNTDPSEMEEVYRDASINACVKQYEKRMDLAWSAADFAICRSGASSVMEQIEYQVPAIFIPYPYDRDGHQKANAHYAQVKVGSGYVCTHDELSIERIEKLFESRSELLRNMEEFKKRRKARPLDTLISEVCQ